MKQILIITIYISISVDLLAQIGKTIDAVNTDGCRLTYKITADNACMLIRNKKAYQKMTNIVVPETIMYKGQVYQVTEIEAGCFRFIDSIEKISLPSSIKELKSTKESEWVKAKSMSGDLDHTDIHYYGMFHNCINLKKVILPDSLSLIGPMAFYGCSSLVEVTLPSGLKDVGGGCFYGCISLHKVTLPSKMTKIKDADYYHAEYSYSTMGYYDKYFHAGFFQDCTTLKDIIIPSSVIEMDSKSFYGCKSLRIVKGFHSKIYIHESYDRWGYQKGQTYKLFENTMINWDSIKATFSYYAEGLIKEDLKNWQKKKDFETIAQYQVRVNKAKRDAKMQELIAKYRKEYIANAEKNQKLSFSIGNYDSEYNVFPLTDTSLGTKYVKVPLADAPLFKENFEKASFSPTYDVINNNLALTRLDVSINSKTYQSEQAATETNSDLVIVFGDLDIDFSDYQGQNNSITQKSTIAIDHTIDQNIPANTANNKQTFAVIIGNERYTQVAQVPYANNDAKIFAEYCKRTLGLPEKNVKVYENATYGTMIGAVSDIQKIAKAFKGDINVIFYYAGHGIPDEATGDGYLLPIDADGMNMRVCYPLSQLYKDLGEMQAKSVTCFMDACFSGAQRGNGMVVAARGVAIKAKADHPTGNTVVFTAATDKQTAYPYEEKGHGMFTYYLLKKLRETKGDCTLGELGTYISDEVAKQAVVTNGKEQTPVVLTSVGVADSWKKLKLK